MRIIVVSDLFTVVSRSLRASISNDECRISGQMGLLQLFGEGLCMNYKGYEQPPIPRVTYPGVQVERILEDYSFQ